MAQRLGMELAARGYTVISGLARGIDGAAHQGALDGGGKTVAVMGCGIDVIYPPDHRKLADAILEGGGALVSELPIGTQPLAENFPTRNRILSGLCLGVVIVEAAEKSGSLITARMALEQDRQVFAVPGSPLTGKTRGSNRLLKDGARLVECVEDVIEELAPQLGLVRRIAEKPKQIKENSGDRTSRPGSDEEKLILRATEAKREASCRFSYRKLWAEPSNCAYNTAGAGTQRAGRSIPRQAFLACLAAKHKLPTLAIRYLGQRGAPENRGQEPRNR